jgi:hypothetical protein
MKLSNGAVKDLMDKLELMFAAYNDYDEDDIAPLMLVDFEEYLKKINLNFKKNDPTQSELEVEE